MVWSTLALPGLSEVRDRRCIKGLGPDLGNRHDYSRAEWLMSFVAYQVRDGLRRNAGRHACRPSLAMSRAHSSRSRFPRGPSRCADNPTPSRGFIESVGKEGQMGVLHESVTSDCCSARCCQEGLCTLPNHCPGELCGDVRLRCQILQKNK